MSTTSASTSTALRKVLTPKNQNYMTNQSHRSKDMEAQNIRDAQPDKRATERDNEDFVTIVQEAQDAVPNSENNASTFVKILQ